MEDTLVDFLRRTALHEIPLDREPDSGREIVDLVEDIEGNQTE